MTDELKTSFWQSAWNWIKRIATLAKPLVSFVPAILLILGAVILVFLGVKNLQIGGLLGTLLGKAPAEGHDAIDVANSVPTDRVDKNGNLIPIGQPDSQGITQAKVVAITEPGLFDNPKQVKITPPGETTPIVINLPDGIKSQDVDKVIVVRPDIYAVSVKDNSGVSAQQVDDLLSKYGG